MRFIALFFIALAFAANLRNTEFDSYLARTNKKYSNAEYRYRLNIFSQNLEKIEEHNSKNLSWKLGVNEYADLTPAEFAGKFCGCAKPKHTTDVTYKPTGAILPESVDWRKSGAVSPVKNQGACGSCWAFSTTGSLETTNFQKFGEMKLFSEQQLVDCTRDSPYGNGGCAGGWPYNGMEYAKKVGLCSEEEYPYEGYDNFCKDSTCTKVVQVKEYVRLPQNDEKALAEAVAQTAVSIVLDASAMQHYSSGIITECTKNMNHAVLAVGYGEENGTKYWIVKNSWGSAWGEEGYCRIQKDTDAEGMCYITYSSVFATELEKL
ncbi:hypothetical protein WA158_001145 [Blastocystis sp. Blastoise]